MNKTQNSLDRFTGRDLTRKDYFPEVSEKSLIAYLVRDFESERDKARYYLYTKNNVLKSH